MAKNDWVKADRYMERSVFSQTNGIWVVEIYSQMIHSGLQLNVRFACESSYAPYSGRSMWGMVSNDNLCGLEDMDLVPAYVVAHARRMVKTVVES